MAKQKQMGADMALAILGVIAWVLAIAFGLDQKVHLERDSYAPNFAAGGAACGFAIAGGLCFVGVVLMWLAPSKKSDSSNSPDMKQ